MAAGIRLIVKDLPIKAFGGRGVALGFTVHQALAQDAVVDALRFWVNVVKDSAERGWPVGPERGRAHSKDLFTVQPVTVSDRQGFVLTNSADYVPHIHEPGKPARFVVDREIKELITALEPSIKEDLLRAFLRGFNRGLS